MPEGYDLSWYNMRMKYKGGRKTFGLVFGAIFLVFGSIVIYHAHTSSTSTDTQLTNEGYYQLQLNTLHKYIDELQTFLASGDYQNNNEYSFNRDTQHYHSLITQAHQPCIRLNRQYDSIDTTNLSDKVADNMSNTKRLCGDLKAVLDYGRALSDATSSYLQLGIQQSTGASQKEILIHINGLESVMVEAKDKLENISVSGVDDPGRQELVSQLNNTHKQLKAVKQEVISDYPTAKYSTSKLVNKIKLDKVNFLNARSYYWRNTIDIDSLAKSISVLEKEFFHLSDNLSR